MLKAAIMIGLLAAEYSASVEAFRHRYEESLRAPNGWLSVAGLFWLHEGVNRAGSDPQSDIVLPAPAPAFAATFQFHAGKVTLHPAPGVHLLINGKAPTGQPIRPDADNITLADLSLTVIVRGPQRATKTGLRLRDPSSAARRNFSGLHWYPIDQHFRIEARWVPYTPPHKVSFTNVVGMTEEDTSPGYAEFQLAGKTWRLEPTEEDGRLFYVFRDQTAGKETYPSGRFLKSDMPKDGRVVLDFNQAYNPPCAFTSFATCPLPPRQNFIAAPIPAGEKKYSDHH
jgi:uncharacterized protein (DUF1684 family)